MPELIKYKNGLTFGGVSVNMTSNVQAEEIATDIEEHLKKINTLVDEIIVILKG